VTAAQHDHLGIPCVDGDELTDARGHLLAVSGDVPDEVPGDPVVDADCVVLPSAEQELPLEDAP